MLGAEKLHGIGDEARARVQRDLRRATASASTPTCSSSGSVSATGSASRSSRSSTAAPRSSSSTSRPPCWCRRRSTPCSRTCATSSAHGHTLLFISHKLDEVLADRRRHHRHAPRHHGRRGRARRRHQARARRADGRLRAALAGAPRSRPSPTTCSSALQRRHPRRRVRAATCSTDISFDIHRGEVLGIAGVEGNGQTELVETIMGMRHATAGHHPARRPGHHRVGHPRAPRGRHRLHPRGPAAPRAAARLAAVGEPHPRPPDPAAQRVEGPWIDRGGAREDTERIVERVRRPHARASTRSPGRCPAATSRS